MQTGPSFKLNRTRSISADAPGEKWQLSGAAVATIATAAAMLFFTSGLAVSRILFSSANSESATPEKREFKIDRELTAMLRRDPIDAVDLAAGIELAPRQSYKPATGPPLNLLAQVDNRAPRPRADNSHTGGGNR